MTNPNVICVIARAKEIVMLPDSGYGYSDVGDVLVGFLRTDISSIEAIERLETLAFNYECARKR